MERHDRREMTSAANLSLSWISDIESRGEIYNSTSVCDVLYGWECELEKVGMSPKLFLEGKLKTVKLS